MNEQTRELEIKIAKVKDSINEIFDDDRIDRFEPKLKSDLKEVNAISVKPLLDQLEECGRLMTSPFYVGVLGRYSHGKSALVNHLFLLEEEDKLPEGDSVVTSKITRVVFDDHISKPMAYMHSNGEQDKNGKPFNSYSEFQKSAQSKDDDNSNIAFLEARIPFGEDQNLAKNFFNNNIQLIDMPGLGGPYFDDSEVVKEYVQNVDLMVVAIKITEIEESAAVVNKFLKKVSCPKIAVLTFYDIAADSNMYASCQGDESKIIAKAKAEVERLFTNLGDIDDISVVSIKNNGLVDKVRNRITQKITVRNSAIAKKVQETPIVEKRRADELKRELDALKVKALALPKRLEALIKDTIGKGKDTDDKIDICSIFDSAKVRTKQQKRKSEIIQKLRQVKTDQVAELNSLVDVAECDSICERIRKRGDLSNFIAERYKEYTTDLKDVANDYIDNLNVSDQQKREFKKSVKDVLDNIEVDGVCFDESNVKASVAVHKAKGMVQKNYKPIIIMCVILAVICLYFSFSINVFELFVASIIFGLIAFVFRFIQKNANTSGAKENALKAKEAMKSALNDATARYEETIFKRIDGADKNIRSDFENVIDMSSYNNDVKQLRKYTEKVSDRISELLEEIETVKYKI